MRFYFEETLWDGWETLRFGDNLKGQHLHLALRGATLLDYQINHQGKPVSICDGFASGDELKYQGSARFFIMAPFANRIPNGIYRFNGQTYMLKPSNPLYPKVRHGLAKDIDFRINKITQDESRLMIELITQEIRPGRFEGYPFELDMVIRFILTDNKLEVNVMGSNLGDRPLPFYAGWHSYFKTSTQGIDHCQLVIPAKKVIKTDINDIPLQEIDCLIDIDNQPELDFRPNKPNIIGSRQLDHGYTDLIPDPDGLIRSSLIDLDNRLKINLIQEKGTVIAFTGDTIQYRPRSSLAIEPVECFTNAFNRPDCLNEITLKPEDSKTYRFAIEYQSGL